MGLAAARSIADEHGGLLWAETTGIGGMIMCPRLPVAG
jgi:signal transduction histidine kinase